MPKKKKTEKYNYLVDYVREAALARNSLRHVCERAVRAYKQMPERNTYKENANRYKQSIANTVDAEKLRAVQAICDSIPDATNDTVFNAVETFVSMAMGGADQFEYQPADEYLTKDPDLVDRLSALAKYFHDDNHIDALVPQATRNMVLQGQGCFYLNPNEDCTMFKVSLIDAWKKLDDPRYLKTNCKRYEGFTEVTHWSTLKKEIYEKNKDYLLSTINDVDAYIRELQGDYNEWEDELREDLDTFKSIYNVSKFENSKSVDDKGNEVSPTKIGYKGDDIEVAYIWDTISHVYGIVVNRRFLVYVEEHPYKKELKTTYKDSNGNEKERTITVELDSPMVTIPYLRLSNETYPTSPLFYCLDDFDAICSMESVMNHNFSIMAPITFLGTSYDAEQVATLSQVAGQIAEGTMNTLQVMNKSHDMSAVLTAIERREQRIKRMLGATDQYELSQMIGNRATAAEVSSMSGIISQRMNNPLANIEAGMSELVQKMFDMYIIFGKDKEYTFSNDGKVSTVSKIDMTGRSLIRAKLKSQIKIQQQEQSRNALMILQSLLAIPQGIVNQEATITTLVPIISQGVVNRRQAESFISQNQLTPDMIEQLQQIITKNQGGEQIMDEASIAALNPQDVDEMSQAANAALVPEVNPMAAPATDARFSAPTVDTGMDNYTAGLESNNANPMGGLI